MVDPTALLMLCLSHTVITLSSVSELWRKSFHVYGHAAHQLMLVRGLSWKAGEETVHEEFDYTVLGFLQCVGVSALIPPVPSCPSHLAPTYSLA